MLPPSMAMRRIPRVDQVFGGSDEVVEHVLFLLEHPGPVPRFTVLTAAPQVREREDAAVLQKRDVAGIERGRATDVESAIAAQQHAPFPLDRQVRVMDEEHRHGRAVL